jgi:general secretion pathway protein K
VALPTHTAINVNTADATVLSAVAEGLSQVDGEALVEARGEGFKDLAGFLSQAPLAGKRVEADLLDVRTDWFLLLTEINIGQARVRLASRILRLRDQLYVVSRQREFPESVVPRVEEAEPAP